MIGRLGRINRGEAFGLEGLKFILASLAERNAKAKAAKPEDFADLTFIEELDRSGYADSLYKKK